MPLLSDRSERLVLVLDDLGDQFLQPMPCLHQHAPTGRRGPVVPAPLSPHHLNVAVQVPEFFQMVECRVKRSLTEPVSVANEFLGDLGAEGRLLGRMVKDVQTNEAVEEMSGNRVVCHNV
jgi:hypothetical protein